MANEKNKFNALTPEVLDENKQIYTEALDYAFSNSDIKNIAITGIYGAGKSTVWNTYVHQKRLSNIITVSLGTYNKYRENYSAEDTNVDATTTPKSLSDKGEEHKIGDNEVDSLDDNRVERQLINQILSQIESNKVPLGKYRFKSNKNVLKVSLQALLSIFFITSVILWIIRESLISYLRELHIQQFKGGHLFFVCAFLFFVPLFYGLYFFYRESKFKISKISFKGAEACVNDDNSDESVLDRDMREGVYLLMSTGTSVVVFEDLDRYNSISIFTKLRELNFLLNHYAKINGREIPVRFVYMLKDGLFYSKSRTKFFDFILPIVPVVDSKTSENKLIELFDSIENSPGRDVLFEVSLYVDDMRVLKNIVNEYIVYSKIIPLGQIKLDVNKLFALITLKNICPSEFDLLQENQGCVADLFEKLESKRLELAQNFVNDIKKINEEIEFLNNRIENNKFEAMALMIPADVSTYYQQPDVWSEFLRNWKQFPEEQKLIYYSQNNGYFSYKEFINRFVITNNDIAERLQKITNDAASEKNRLYLCLRNAKRNIKNIETYTYKELISRMTNVQRKELFATTDDVTEKNHQLDLIRFLITDGLLDETYWYYKGAFDMEKAYTLKKNDTIYIKGLLEGKELDVFLEVETPYEVLNRLKLSDYSRFNILNSRILKACLEKENYQQKIVAIADSVDQNSNYSDLISILDSFNLETVGAYSNILIKENIDLLVKTVDYCIKNNEDVMMSILISILVSKNRTSEELEAFRKYINGSEYILSLLPEENYVDFTHNIHIGKIKFDDLSKANCRKDRLESIGRLQAYKLNVKNVLFISEKVLERSINYGNLLDEVYKSRELLSSKEYIEDNFSEFISEYIGRKPEGIVYTNSETILLDILQSNIAYEDKLAYIENNETFVSRLTDLHDIELGREIIDSLLQTNKLKFSSENITVYWSKEEQCSCEFISYLDMNIREDNCKAILQENVSMCNSLINNPLINDQTFKLMLPFVDKEIDEINSQLDRIRVKALIEESVVSATEQNVNILMANSFNEELTLLVNLEEDEDSIIGVIARSNPCEDLIYLLVNSNISDENAKVLVKLIKNDVLIEKINQNKRSIIRYIVDSGLTKANISYICRDFENFSFKNDFVKALDKCNELAQLDDKYLNPRVMKYILQLPDVAINTKISLIERKIKNHLEVDVLKDFITLVPEIEDLSNVWNKKQPLLDNDFKETIGQALLEEKYVKFKESKEGRRIMCVKKN